MRGQLFKQSFAVGSGYKFLFDAIKELESESVFERFYMLADARLSEVQLVRSLGHTARAVHRFEDAQVIHIDLI